MMRYRVIRKNNKSLKEKANLNNKSQNQKKSCNKVIHK